MSKDTFEHVDDEASLLKGLGQLLGPGGRLYAGFIPLYGSPIGDHTRTGLACRRHTRSDPNVRYVPPLPGTTATR